jgi:macrodomain Ter protein organizer (MatP/YcbG family)
MWWRVAIQAYIQQRMSMQLVQKKTEISIPSRFDRIYQTEKLAQFDKLFSRSWAVPVRLSHAAQHSQPDAADICVSHYANFTHSQKKQHTSAPGSNDEDILSNILLPIMALNQNTNLF